MQRTELNAQSNSGRAKIIREMDGLCREIVLYAYNNTCAMCRIKSDELDAAHIIGKQSNPIHRHDVLNIIPLHRECHQKAHADPIGFLKMIEEMYPALYDWHMQIVKVKPKGTRSMNLMKMQRDLLKMTLAKIKEKPAGMMIKEDKQ